VTQIAAKPQREVAPQRDPGDILLPEVSFEDSRAWQAERIRLLGSVAGSFFERELSVFLSRLSSRS